MIDLSKKLRRAVEWAALPWPWFLVLLSGILIGAGWLIAAGPATQDEWAGDIFAFIDGAWRVMQGQRPHVDFNTSLGFGFFLIMALGFELFGMSIHAVPGLLALLGVTIALWCWAVSITRLRPWMAALLSLVAGFYVLGPAPPGLDFHLSYGGMYNKLGHSLLLILCCDAVAPSIGPSSRWREALLGISTGTILCIFATTKLTFLFPAVAAIAFSAIFLRRGRVWWGGLGASLAVGVIATTIYLRGDPLAMLRDFFFVMRARGNRVGEHTHLPLIMQMTLRTLAVGWGKPLEFVRLELEHLAMLALGALLLATGSPILKEDRARLVAILFLLPTATAVALTSWQWSDVPMIAFLGILLAEGAVRGRAQHVDEPVFAVRRLAICGLAAVLCAQPISRNALNIAYAEARQRPAFRPPPALAMTDEAYRNFYVIFSGGCRGTEYSSRMNEGLDLLRKSRVEDGRILVFDFSNPFSFALRRRSPRGDAVSWSSRSSFSRETFLPPEQVFKEVDIVMMPKCSVEPWTTKDMQYLYGPTVERDFEKELESRSWVLLVRRKPSG